MGLFKKNSAAKEVAELKAKLAKTHSELEKLVAENLALKADKEKLSKDGLERANITKEQAESIAQLKTENAELADANHKLEHALSQSENQVQDFVDLASQLNPNMRSGIVKALFDLAYKYGKH